MKKERRRKVVFEDIFVSVDGREFDNEKDCLDWEKSKDTLNARWELMKKVTVDGDKLGLPDANKDDECYILKPKDFKEIALINEYIGSELGDNRMWVTTEHINKTIALIFGYYGNFCDVYIVSNIVEEIKAYAAKMEKELEGGSDEQRAD
jgi:hypothetical protein